MAKPEKTKKKLVVWMVTPEEFATIQRLKEVHKRHSNADLLRYLVNADAEKFFGSTCVG